MPNVTLYIRNSDMEKWRNLENKSEVIHQLLHEMPISSPVRASPAPFSGPVNMGTGEPVVKDWIPTTTVEADPRLLKWRRDQPDSTFRDNGGIIEVQNKYTKQWMNVDNVDSWD